WFPYPNKTMFFIDLLDSLPRLRLSDAHMRMIILVLEECGAKDVPTLYALRKCQEQLRAKCAPQTVQHRSGTGNVFYSNDIRDTIAMEFSNPQVAPHFHPYPEIRPNGISESWEASRWREVPRELLPPMMALGNQHFFLDEIAQLNDGRFVVPHEWVTIEGVRSGLCRSMATCMVCKLSYFEAYLTRCRHLAWLLLDQTQILSRFQLRLLDGRSRSLLQRTVFQRSHFMELSMPNPLRAVADGDELFTVFVNLWADDVSGNVSKQYNKHINIYVSNMGLPSTLLQQEYFVRFVSTSPTASGPEQFAAIKEHIIATHKEPRQCYHAVSRKTCKFRIVAQALPGDNPQQSENCSHAGGMSTRHCRRCMNVRRPAEGDQTASWFADNFAPGTKRTTQDTLRFVEEQFDIACTGVASAVKAAQTASGVKDSIASVWIDRLINEARRLQSLGEESAEAIAEKLMIWLWDQPGDKYHPLLEWAGLDPHADTPVEILHTILLGLAKYVWYGLHTSWTEAMQALFVIRLQSTDISGLSIPPFRAAYMMQYKNNLIGKHFKALLQTQVFHLHELTTDKQFALAKASGALAAHIWFERIYDMEEYLADLRILIANVLDAFTELDPTRIVIKAKLHVLTHLPDDIPRFGPGVRFATEIFECFNAIFRMCSVLSNHQAPSRDIAISLANMDRMKHMISGGYWKEGDEWAQASEDVRRVLQDHPLIQRHFGWAPPIIRTPARPYQLSDVDIARFRSTCTVTDNALLPDLSRFEWHDGVSVVSESGDVCKTSAWVVYNCEVRITGTLLSRSHQRYQGDARLGRIKHIHVPVPLEHSVSMKPLVTIQRYNVADKLHPEFEMPYLRKPSPGTDSIDVILASDIKFIVNVQHDCRAAGCQPTAKRAVHQERQLTEQHTLAIEHDAKEFWVVNTHAFHNAVLLRRVLGRSLVAPKLNTPNRDDWLAQKEKEARFTLVTKQEEANLKAAETRARKRLNKEQEAADRQAPANPDANEQGAIQPAGASGKRRRADEAGEPAGSSTQADPPRPSKRRRR
ncbi:hypothetical protein AURDEDRAFT_75744, partial [Auricularia subglabra TFB-10046 SS5]